jgi:hypothetical protein
MGRGLAAALLSIVACAAAGCGSSSSSSGTTHATTQPLPKNALGVNVTVSKNVSTAPYSDEEKTYLRKLHGWLGEVGAASARLDFATHGPAHDDLLKGKVDARLKPQLRILSSCSSRLAALGTPTSARLQQGVKVLGVACAKFAAAAKAVIRAGRTKDPSALVYFDDDMTQSGEAYAAAEHALAPQETRDLPLIARPSTKSHIDTKLSDAVATTFDMSTEVRCWSKNDWPKIVKESNAFSVTPDSPGTVLLGFVLTGDRINLSPQVCTELADLVYDHQRPTNGDAQLHAAEGLVVLTHEAEHVSGVGVEAEAECYAMQDAADDGIALGLGKSYARSLSTLYWQRVYPDDLPNYRSADCHSGGQLDLYSDSLWP